MFQTFLRVVLYGKKEKGPSGPPMVTAIYNV